MSLEHSAHGRGPDTSGPRKLRAGASHLQRAAKLAALLSFGTLMLAGCSLASKAQAQNVVTIAVVAPESGPDAQVGTSVDDAVQLAVDQNASLPNGYQLTYTHLDSTLASGDQLAGTLVGDTAVVGVVGPLGSDSAAAMLPRLTQASLATISPSAGLPSLTQVAKGAPVVFFRLAPTDDATGAAAADLALTPTSAHGLGAASVFVVDDGSASGKALGDAFTSELKTKHGQLAGRATIDTNPQASTAGLLAQIVAAWPDAVFYGGDSPGGATLRATLSLSGLASTPLLITGLGSDSAAWSSQVGMAQAATNTTAILSAADLSTLNASKSFTDAYQQAYPQHYLSPLSALAYDAAMDEISAIKALLNAHKPVTRANVRAAIAGAQYAGSTGTVAFNQQGESRTPPALSIYTCDNKGAWHFVSIATR